MQEDCYFITNLGNFVGLCLKNMMMKIRWCKKDHELLSCLPQALPLFSVLGQWGLECFWAAPPPPLHLPVCKLRWMIITLNGSFERAVIAQSNAWNIVFISFPIRSLIETMSQNIYTLIFFWCFMKQTLKTHTRTFKKGIILTLWEHPLVFKSVFPIKKSKGINNRKIKFLWFF